VGELSRSNPVQADGNGAYWMSIYLIKLLDINNLGVFITVHFRNQ
jgi:hypothetical protein